MTWHALLLLYIASNRRVSGAWSLVLKGNPTFFVGDQINHQKLMCSTRGVVLSPLALRLGRLWRRPLGYLRRLTNSVGGRRSRAGRRIGIRRNIPPTRNILNIMLTRAMKMLCKTFPPWTSSTAQTDHRTWPTIPRRGLFGIINSALTSTSDSHPTHLGGALVWRPSNISTPTLAT